MSGKQQILSDKEVIDFLLDPLKEKDAMLYLYSAYFDPLSWFVKQNNGSLAEAQDVFQEVVVSFVNLVKQHKFRGESSIKTFLFSINRNIWYNELKRRERQGLREIKYELSTEPHDARIETIIERRESSRQLMEILDSLGETCKKILHLFYYENYAIKDLLTVLNYENEQVVRNKKHKCLKKLEEMIGQDKNFYHQLKSLLHG